MNEIASSTRRIWLTLEAEEIIELKRLMMDCDVKGARAFFHQTVFPRVRRAAERREMRAERSPEQLEEDARGDRR